MVMFGEEAHGSQAMMCETMRLTAVSIIIEKPFFWSEENASIWNQTPDHKLIMLTL